MGTIGMVFGVWSYLRLRETLTVASERPLTVASVTQGFRLVLGNRSALFYGLSGVFLFGGILGYVNTSQQVYVGIYGLGALFPLAFAAAPVTFAIAFLLNSRLVARFGMRRLAHGAMLSFVAVTTIWLVCDLAGFMPLWLYMTMLALTILAQGLAWGNVGSLSMEPLGEVAGTAAAVFGMAQTVGAALLSYVVAQAFDGTTTAGIIAFFVFGLIVVGCFLVAERGRLFQPGGNASAEADHGRYSYSAAAGNSGRSPSSSRVGLNSRGPPAASSSRSRRCSSAMRGLERRASRLNTTGVRNSVAMVAKPRPPTMIQPSARRASAPAPAVSSSGRPPSTVAIMVITIGRSRISAALRMASITDCPWSRSWLGELDHQDAVLRHQADEHDEADFGINIERAAGEHHGVHRRGEAERHGRHQDERRDEAFELRREHEDDDEEREANVWMTPPDAVFSSLASPV